MDRAVYKLLTLFPTQQKANCIAVIRFIVRPSHILTTPKALKQVLRARRTIRYPFVRDSRLASWKRDFFLSYPPLTQIEEFKDHALAEIQAAGRHHRGSESTGLSLHGLLPDSFNGYARVRSFFRSSKFEQRRYLGGIGFPIPSSYATGYDGFNPNGFNPEALSYVIRPFRHSEGRDFRVLTTEDLNQEGSWNPNAEYLSELYPKTHEYRVLIVRGEPLITLLKQVPEDTPVDAPWNHAHGARFITVNDWNNNRLRHTDVYDLIRSNQDFFSFVDLGGLDIMFNRDDPLRPYVVCELNLCPSVSIPANLERIAQYVAQVLR